MRDGPGPAAEASVDVGLVRSLDAMAPPGFHLALEHLLDLGDRTLLCRLLDDRGSEVQIGVDAHDDDALRQTLGEVVGEVTEIVGEVGAQGFLGRDQRQAAGGRLHHVDGRGPQLGLVGLGREVLVDHLPGRDGGDGHGSVHHGLDNVLQSSGERRAHDVVEARLRGDLGRGDREARAEIGNRGGDGMGREGSGDAGADAVEGQALEGLEGLGDDQLGNLLDGDPVQDLAGRLDTLVVEVQALAEDLDLEFEIQLELRVVVELDEEVDDVHQPRIGWAEDVGLESLDQDLADERDDDDQALRVVGFDQKLLEGYVLLLDRPVAGEGQQSEPATQVLQVRPLGRVLHRQLGVEHALDAREGLA